MLNLFRQDIMDSRGISGSYLEDRKSKPAMCITLGDTTITHGDTTRRDKTETCSSKDPP